jgi:uncharacterized small protein (DUF1192 family)
MTPDQAMTGQLHSMDEYVLALNALRVEVTRLHAELADYKNGRPFATEALTKLARVEAWYAKTTTSDHDELLDAMDELGNEILRGKP